MDMQELLRRSFAIWWRVRALWWAGMIAALVGYGEYGASMNFQWNSSRTVPITPGGPPPLDQLRELEPQLGWLFDNLVPIILCVVVGALIWAIVAGLIGSLAHGAMIQIADGASRELPVSFGEGMRAGSARMVPLFLIGFILALPGLLLAALVFALVGGVLWQVFTGRVDDPAQIAPTLFGAVCCVILLAIPALIIGLALRLLGRLAARACVIEGRGPLDSLRRGWSLLRGNLGPTLLLWLVVGIAGVVLNVILGLPALALLIPIGLSIGGGGPSAGLIILGGLILLLYGLIVNVGIGGALTGLNATIWTLHYRRLLGGEGVGAPPPSPQYM